MAAPSAAGEQHIVPWNAAEAGSQSQLGSSHLSCRGRLSRPGSTR